MYTEVKMDEAGNAGTTLLNLLLLMFLDQEISNQQKSRV